MLRREPGEGVGEGMQKQSLAMGRTGSVQKKARPGVAKAQWTRNREGGQTGDEDGRWVGRAGRVSPSWFGVWILFVCHRKLPEGSEQGN